MESYLTEFYVIRMCTVKFTGAWHYTPFYVVSLECSSSQVVTVI
jgi:hypothetical protein